MNRRNFFKPVSFILIMMLISSILSTNNRKDYHYSSVHDVKTVLYLDSMDSCSSINSVLNKKIGIKKYTFKLNRLLGIPQTYLFTRQRYIHCSRIIVDIREEITSTMSLHFYGSKYRSDYLFA